MTSRVPPYVILRSALNLRLTSTTAFVAKLHPGPMSVRLLIL
jgi:hypothetical protein